MSIYITQLPRRNGPIAVNFPSPFESAPTVLVTPYWKGQGTPVGSIETVLSPVTANGCKISGDNQASNYSLNILAIDPKDTLIGTLGVNAGVHAKMVAGQTTINFADPLQSNDPVALLAPQWTSTVGFVEYMVASAASEITTYSQNMAPGGAYAVDYLAANRGASSFQDSFTGFNQFENGTYNKTGSGMYRIYFESPFVQPPMVFLSPWWNGTQSTVSSIETVVDVTSEYFDAVSGNSGPNYFVNWMAFGNA
jgi:hypothetical protein